MRGAMLTALALLLPAMPAAAAVVINMAATPEAIDAKSDGYFKPYAIESGERVYFVSSVWLRYAGREIFVAANETFTIWNDGYTEITMSKH